MRQPHRILPLMTIFLLSLGISLASGPRDDTRLVTLDVAVADKAGHPVVGLDQRHFRVFEDNLEQTITRFDSNPKPVAAVLLVEFSDTFGYYDEVIAPAREFINSLQHEDWLALVTFGVQTEIVTDFTRDKNALFDGIRRMQMPFSRETSLYDAVYFVLERLEDVQGKKAIFLISTGLDTVSNHSYAETLKKAQDSDVMIYSVGMAQSARMVLEPYMEAGGQIRLLQADNVMRAFADDTGGLSFFPRFSGEYREIHDTVGADLKSQYTLGYVSTNQTIAGKFRKLRVEVMDSDIDHNGKPDKLRIRYKKGH